MCDWFGLDLDLEPERPELPLRAPFLANDQAVVVRQYRPAVADRRWLDAGGTLVRSSYQPHQRVGEKNTPCARFPPGGSG